MTLPDLSWPFLTFHHLPSPSITFHHLYSTWGLIYTFSVRIRPFMTFYHLPWPSMTFHNLYLTLGVTPASISFLMSLKLHWMTPGWPQDDPRMTQGWPKDDPRMTQRWLQDVSKIILLRIPFCLSSSPLLMMVTLFFCDARAPSVLCLGATRGKYFSSQWNSVYSRKVIIQVQFFTFQNNTLFNSTFTLD